MSGAEEEDNQQGTLALVKVEPGAESINDIQNYLETFNKEIEGGDGPREGSTFYVDANGQYYYTQPVMCVSSDEQVTGGSSLVATAGSVEGSSSGSGTTQTVTLTGEAGAQMLINPTEASFGTVTLVPQDNGAFVVFVQAPDSGKEEEEHLITEGEEGEDQDLTVYDFEEDAGVVDQAGNDSEEEEKPRVVKIVNKKTLQNVTTAHMCNYCNYTSPKRYLLSRHMKSHSEERPHKCSVCERGFKTLASLQNHVNTHTGTKPHHCRFCNSSFTTSGELVRHIRYKHTLEKPHKCTECDYSSVELSKLRNHIRCHTGERPFQCPHCTYASPDTFKLKRHLRIHTGEKPYECELCHARFTQSNSLKAHRLIHSTADKPVFRCELCPATCGRKTDLRIHVQKLHTSDRLMKCKRCGKAFPDRYTYKVHIKTHEGEKCYRCDLCPYASISARHLESHMLIHTDQKPFKCDVCDQAFRQKQLLKRHQNLYHTPDYTPPAPKEKTHECPECGRAFRHKGNLIRHMAVHDPDSPAQDNARALKMGRQKKVQFIDGQQVELVDDELSDDGGVVGDGPEQQYVVLEVIQMSEENDDGEGTGFIITSEEQLLNPGAGTEVSGEDKDDSLSEDKPLIKVERRVAKMDGVDDCFGFGDEEDEAVDETEQIVETKVAIVSS